MHFFFVLGEKIRKENMLVSSKSSKMTLGGGFRNFFPQRVSLQSYSRGGSFFKGVLPLVLAEYTSTDSAIGKNDYQPKDSGCWHWRDTHAIHLANDPCSMHPGNTDSASGPDVFSH